jgi:hypothetical protein
MYARRRLAATVATAVLAGGLASPTLAADSVTVDAQVSLVAPCLTVSTTSVDFGPMLPETETTSSLSFRPISYTNCSAASEQIYSHGTNATEGGGPAAWALSGANLQCPDFGLNRFRLFLLTEAEGLGSTLTTVDQLVETVPAGADGVRDQLILRAPCQGSDGAGSIMSFSIIFTATF